MLEPPLHAAAVTSITSFQASSNFGGLQQIQVLLLPNEAANVSLGRRLCSEGPFWMVLLLIAGWNQAASLWDGPAAGRAFHLSPSAMKTGRFGPCSDGSRKKNGIEGLRETRGSEVGVPGGARVLEIQPLLQLPSVRKMKLKCEK